MNKHLKKIQLYFSISIFILTSLVVSGSFLARNRAEDIARSAALAFNSFKYEISYAQSHGDKNGGLATVATIITERNSDAEKSNKKAERIPVLLYHGIVDEPDGSSVLLEDFEEQMFTLKSVGWQTITTRDLYLFMRGDEELPDKSFLLTFDDGRKDSYYPVDPILKALNYNAVMFVIVGRSEGGSFHLSFLELRKMARSGRWELQAHAYKGHSFEEISQDSARGHFYSNKLWSLDEKRLETREEFTDRVRVDLQDAKSKLENEFGIEVSSFAYPYGDFGQNSLNFSEARMIVPDIVKSIYLMSFYQTWPGDRASNFNYKGQDSFLVRRINVNPDWNSEDLLRIVETGI